MWFPRILPDRIVTEITCADISSLLSMIATEGIILKNIEYCDDLTVRITINEKNYSKIVTLCQKRGAIIKRIRYFGISSAAKKFLKRPVLLVFSLIVFLLGCYIPGRIFFISVEGNAQLADRYILEAVTECGINFGAKRRLVRSENMKNRLLEKIPQLQWAGINTYGCTAVISVREKTANEIEHGRDYQVSSIVASRHGVIQSCTVYQGNALCVVGQAVKAGQTLVSGYLDCGIITKTMRADAEIRALTFRDLEALSPAYTALKGEVRDNKTHYSLKIGKKLIKLCKDSGNLDTTCGKIYEEEYVYLPGGFRLPIAIVKETEIRYEIDKGVQLDANSADWLKYKANAYLEDIMISGEIISADAEVTIDDVYHLRGRYTCSEMIGQIKREETIPKDDAK